METIKLEIGRNNYLCFFGGMVFDLLFHIIFSMTEKAIWPFLFPPVQ